MGEDTAKLSQECIWQCCGVSYLKNLTVLFACDIFQANNTILEVMDSREPGTRFETRQQTALENVADSKKVWQTTSLSQTEMMLGMLQAAEATSVSQIHLARLSEVGLKQMLERSRCMMRKT